ncbi:hypothetical protein ACUC2M_05100 [Bacillus cytotoxicus]
MLLKKMMLGILATSLITGWTGDTHLNKLKEDVTEIQTNVPKFVNTFDTLKKKFDEFAQNANNKIGQANQIIENKVQYINWLHETLDQVAQENNQEKQRVKTLQEDSDKLKQQLTLLLKTMITYHIKSIYSQTGSASTHYITAETVTRC